MFSLTDDDQYFSRREQQVREMAAKAQDPAVRAAHSKLASLYAERLRQKQSA